MTTTQIELSPLKLLTLGYSVVPSGGGPTGKSPLILWAEYQEHLADENDFEKWEMELHPNLWGVVTGKLSDVVIIDIDDPKKKTIFDNYGLLPVTQTPRGGYHYWFRHPGTPVKTCTGILPGIDVRGDGGFVNVFGKRKDGEYITLNIPTPDVVYPWEKLPPEIYEAIKAQNNGHSKQPVREITTEFFPEGTRNESLFRIGSALRRQGFSETAIYAALSDINNTQCLPPLPDNEVLSIAKSSGKYLPENNVTGSKSIYNLREMDAAVSQRDKNVTKSVTNEDVNVSHVTREKIEEWVRGSYSWFSYDDVDKELGIKSAADKANRRKIFQRLKEEGIIECHPQDNKRYRFINVSVRLIDFKSAVRRSPLAIKFPFEIEKYASVYPGNIIVLAGAANAGKTAFLLNTIRLNMYDFSIFYQSSEMGQDELAIRLEKFDGLSLQDWNFTAEERSQNFADVIRPDCVNIIDYMELSSDCFMIAEYLKQIHERLKTGIAIVALQKKIGSDMGRGGEFGLEKPRLYLSMDAGKLKITKAKNWANLEINPNGLVLNFKVAAGCKFIIDENWHKEDYTPGPNDFVKAKQDRQKNRN